MTGKRGIRAAYYLSTLLTTELLVACCGRGVQCQKDAQLKAEQVSHSEVSAAPKRQLNLKAADISEQCPRGIISNGFSTLPEQSLYQFKNQWRGVSNGQCVTIYAGKFVKSNEGVIVVREVAKNGKEEHLKVIDLSEDSGIAEVSSSSSKAVVTTTAHGKTLAIPLTSLWKNGKTPVTSVLQQTSRPIR